MTITTVFRFVHLMPAPAIKVVKSFMSLSIHTHQAYCKWANSDGHSKVEITLSVEVGGIIKNLA